MPKKTCEELGKVLYYKKRMNKKARELEDELAESYGKGPDKGYYARKKGKKWQADYFDGEKTKYVGVFDTKAEALEAAKKARKNAKK